MQVNRYFLFLTMGLAVLLILRSAIALAGHLEPFKDVPVSIVNPQTPEKIELGKKLFFDRRLSGDGTMSCVTCHMPELAFCDGQAISLSYPTTKNWRNSPTLINVAFSRYLFYDGRAESLEDQALFPMMSAFEMNQNLDFLEEEIRAVDEYRQEFKKVFGSEETSRQRIAMALAAFERTLISRNAPLDRYLSGEAAALSPAAKQGYALFIGKGKCTECHFGVNLIDDNFHALNVPELPEFNADPRVAATRRFVGKLYHFDAFRTLAEDPGRYLITKEDKDWRAFKTSTLRDISKTGPYMHNGVFETLDAVIDFFDQGGGAGNTALQPLGLTTDEKKDLRIFLEEALAGDDIIVEYPALP
jgi:cytochrome c peroxidase